MKSKLSLFSILLLIAAILFSPVSGALAAGSPQDEPPQPQVGGLKVYLPIAVGGNEGAVLPTATATQPGPTATLPPGVTPTATQIPPTVVAPTATATTVPVPTDADLALLVSVNPSGRIVVPLSLAYTLTVTNLGPADAAGAEVTVTPDARLGFVSASATQGTYDNGTKKWALGTLANGATTTLTLTLSASGSVSGTVPFSASVTSGAGDPAPANNSAAVSNQVNSPGAIRSDDFNSTKFDSSWTWVNPLNLATRTADGTHMRISIPAGTPHYVWRPNDPSWTGVSQAPRMLQSVNNPAEFEITAKFETRPTGSYAGNGIWIEYDENDFIRFEFFSFGSTQINVYAVTIIDGVLSAPFVDENVTANLSGNVSYLRVARNGSSFTLKYSNDGVTWFDIPGTLTFGKQVRKVGLYAATSMVSGGTAPAFTMAADYFIETSDPIANEDPIHPSFVFSDDFNAGWNKSLWTKMNSTPAIEFLNFTSTQATMYVGTGVEHDLWDQSEPDPALRVKPVGLVQKMNNRSFDFEVKFDSRPLKTYAAQGLMLMTEDQLNLIQFYYYSFETNTGANLLKIYASEVVNGENQGAPPLLDITIPADRIPGDTMLLRIVRQGSQWTLKYGDGVNWYDAKVFTSSLAPEKVAIVVGNEDHQGNGSIPGYTAYIDYFQNNDMPIAVHD